MSATASSSTDIGTARAADRPRAFRREGLVRRTAPFLVVAATALLLSPFVLEVKPLVLGLTLLNSVVLVGAVLLVPWERTPRWADIIVPLLGMLNIAMIREATGGGASVLTPLVFLPVFWLALYGSRREILIMVGALGVVTTVPVFLDPTHYSTEELGRAVLGMTLAAAMSLIISEVVIDAEQDAQRLRASLLAQARLAAIVEHSADAIIGVTIDGRVDSWNNGAARLFGYARGQAMGLDVTQLAPPDERVDARLLHGRVLRGEVISNHPMRRLIANGDVTDVSVTMSPIRGADGSIAGVAAIERDASEQRRAELATRLANEELQHANELKTRFVAMVSHELRTPLTSIRGFSSTLRDLHGQLPPSEQLRFLEIIEAQSLRLSRLVEDVLTLSRIESDGVASKLETLHPREMIDRVLEQLGIESVVTVDCDPLLEALADRDQLDQQLVNYLTNARRYGRPPITVRAERIDDRVVVSVIDAGDGVPEEFVSRLFDRFTRVPGSDEPTEEFSGGTGLGLSIVRALAQAQGGDAWYEPNDPAGARFCLSLRTPPK